MARDKAGVVQQVSLARQIGSHSLPASRDGLLKVVANVQEEYSRRIAYCQFPRRYLASHWGKQENPARVLRSLREERLLKNAI